MQVPAEDRDRHGESGEPSGCSPEKRAPISALQKKDKEQDREDLAGCGDGDQRSCESSAPTQICPAGGDDQQQKEHIELAVQQVAMERKAKRKNQRDTPG